MASSMTDRYRRNTAALAAGARVVCRAPEVPIAELYPGLADLEPHVDFYQTSKELAELAMVSVSSASRSPEHCRTIATQHTVAHRLKYIVNTIRQRRGTPVAIPEP